MISLRTVCVTCVIAVVGGLVASAVAHGDVALNGVLPWLLSFLATAGGAGVAMVRSEQAARRVDEVHGLVEPLSEAVQDLIAQRELRAAKEVDRILHTDGGTR